MEKLVRSKDFMDVPSRTRRARPEELPLLLGHKLVEEAREALQVLRFHGSVMLPAQRRERLLDELADVSEVVSTIRVRYGIRDVEIDARTSMKRITRGPFIDKVLVDAPDERDETKLRTLVEDLVGCLHGAIAPDLFNQLVDRARELGCMGETA